MTRILLFCALCVSLACQTGVAWAGEEAEDDDAEASNNVRPRVTLAQRFAVVHALETQADEFEQKIVAMEASATSFRNFMRCTSLVPVSQYGDPDHGFGFEYDDRNSAGLDYRPALSLHRDARRWPDYAFLNFSEREECQSATTVPGGTADNAEAPATPGIWPQITPAVTPVTISPVVTARRTSAARGRVDVRRRVTLATRVRSLHARVENLQRREARLEDMSERFDEWESCLSWVPVTEYGDPDGTFGYLQQRTDGSVAGYRTTIAVDNSEWDDPDYEFLAFVGRDRPFTNRECGNEPGESVD